MAGDPQPKGQEPKGQRQRRTLVNEAYSIQRAAYLLDHQSCEARWSEVTCRGYATEVHHLRARSTSPTTIADPDVFLATCRPCHEQIEANPTEAEHRGLRLRAGS